MVVSKTTWPEGEEREADVTVTLDEEESTTSKVRLELVALQAVRSGNKQDLGLRA